MAIHYNPTTVSDGLVLALDAQNSRSYGGSGTTWTDVSYTGNNGTLTNGPTFEPGGPFAGSTGGSVSFDGTSSDYLSIGNDSSLTFGSGDFTIEAWMNFDTAYNYTLLEKGSDWSFIADANRWVFKYGNTNSFVISWTPTFGQWYHVACVRNGSTVTLYIDGQSIGSGPAYTSVADTGDLLIGTSVRFPGYNFDGYVSNLRIIKGTALYISNFTPPIKPLTPVSGTSLLTCQGGAIVDNSSNKFSITKNGDARAIQSASIKFDGVNDYAILNNNSFFNFGNGDFCIEANVFLTNYSSNYSGFYGATIFGKDSNPTREYAFGITGGASNYTSIAFSFNPGSGNLTESISGNYNFNLNTWYHTCISRIGNTMTLFVNGSVLTTTTTTSTISTTSVQPRVGSGGYGGYEYFFPGYVSNTRVYKGKGLTAEEVEQNYNALKGRFGL